MNSVDDSGRYRSLRQNVSALGSMLGETMAEDLGDEFLAVGQVQDDGRIAPKRLMTGG